MIVGQYFGDVIVMGAEMRITLNTAGKFIEASVDDSVANYAAEVVDGIHVLRSAETNNIAGVQLWLTDEQWDELREQFAKVSP